MNERTFQAGHAHKLDDPARLEWLPPSEVLDSLALQPGSIVADIGAGTGYFTIPLARAVGPNGRVFAVDFQPAMLAHIRAKLDAADAPANIELVEGSADRTSLHEASCDLAFFANIWHEMDDPAAVIEEASRILKPAGRLAILDWRSDLSSPPGPPDDHRLAAADVAASLSRNGWSVDTNRNVGHYSYLIQAHRE